MEIIELIRLLDSHIENPSSGLPEEVFLFASRITPLINVDLLIKNELNHTLLTWRDDGYYSAGWHVPGGIVRYKEIIHDRIHAVAAGELGAPIRFKTEPMAINEIIHPTRKDRGHFISLLYDCRLTGPPNSNLRYAEGVPKPGEWAWHSTCPVNIIQVHEIYRQFM